MQEASPATRRRPAGPIHKCQRFHTNDHSNSAKEIEECVIHFSWQVLVGDLPGGPIRMLLSRFVLPVRQANELKVAENSVSAAFDLQLTVD